MMWLRRLRRKWKKILLIIAPLVAGLLVLALYPFLTGEAIRPLPTDEQDTEEQEEDFAKVGFTAPSSDFLDTEGFTQVAVEAFPGAALLRDNCTGVFIAMSNLKSFSIKRGLENTLDIRPNYHDLAYDIIDHYGGKVVLAKVSRLANDFYYADLYIEQDGNILHLDSRPSDALGIASRFGAPVYISDKILERQGVDVCRQR